MHLNSLFFYFCFSPDSFDSYFGDFCRDGFGFDLSLEFPGFLGGFLMILINYSEIRAKF